MYVSPQIERKKPSCQLLAFLLALLLVATACAFQRRAHCSSNKNKDEIQRIVSVHLRFNTLFGRFWIGFVLPIKQVTFDFCCSNV